MKERRTLHPNEVRLFLFADYADPEGQPLPNSMLHAVRQTVNGQKLAPCTASLQRLNDGMNYWSFPLLDFLIVHAPICEECMSVMLEEGLLVDTRTPA